MSTKTLWLPLLCGLACSPAFAGTYEWSAGYAQGVAEHLVDDGNGNELNISCPDDGETAVTAYATIAGKAYASEKDPGFDVIVDGERYSNPFFTGCDVCSQNFPAFWKALRNANNLQISAGGKTVKLPTKKLKQVLKPFESKTNQCRVTW